MVSMASITSMASAAGLLSLSSASRRGTPRVMEMPTASAPALRDSALPVAVTGCLGEASNKQHVCFNVFLPSGRFATISCLSTETLKGLQLQIAALLGLKAAKPLCDGIPLLRFFRPTFSEFSSLLCLDTLAAELQGCSVQVLQQEHPDWCRHRCFFRHSPAMDWDIEEEITEWLWLFSNGQFRYLRHRYFWNEGVHTWICKLGEVDREEFEGIGSWRCILLEGLGGDSSLEEVVTLEGTAKTWHQSSRDQNAHLQRKIRMTFPKATLLRNYESIFLDP